jgi:ABC-type phosphate/phosphonate transport system substrate-binding protein
LRDGVPKRISPFRSFGRVVQGKQAIDVLDQVADASGHRIALGLSSSGFLVPSVALLSRGLERRTYDVP